MITEQIRMKGVWPDLQTVENLVTASFRPFPEGPEQHVVPCEHVVIRSLPMHYTQK